MSGGHGPSVEGNNKYIALMIAVLALCLAFSEMLGKNAEKASVQANIEASNLWAFFQAKTIRRSLAQNFVEFTEADSAGLTDEAKKAAIGKQIESWKRLAARMESEPETNEGRRELMARAQAAEKKRDLNNIKGEGFEIASALLQVAIVVAFRHDHHRRRHARLRGGPAGVAAVALMAVSQFSPMLLPFH